MKGYILLGLFFLISLLLNTGCSKNKDNDIIQAEEDMRKYEIDNPIAYNVDEDGSLYVSGMLDNESNAIASDNRYLSYLHKYELDGTLDFSHTFDSSINSIGALTVNGDVIFFTSSGTTKDGGAGILLYSYNIKTEQIECIYEFDYFEQIKQLIYLDDRIYIIGYNPYSTLKSEDQPKSSYQSMGEKLVYYSLSDKAAYEIGVKNPITMSLNDDTLMINAYMDNEGYCLLNYDPKKDSVKVAATFSTNKIQYFAVCDNGTKVIYTYNNNSRGLVMSDISSIDEEAELYPEVSFVDGIYHMKGQVYCVTQSRSIVRISLDPDKMKSPIIRYISSGYQGNGPFGCGYTMLRNELSEDKLAIKVLAQDKDYDLCYLNSLSSTSYNISKNGVFLPLNKVKGINEYLDTCFPYVKAAAINESGDIWMLPVMVDIPGLLVNEEYLASENIALKNNITYEEFYQVYEGMSNELLNKTRCNSYVIYSNFFAQTFNKKANLNNEEFKSKLKLFQRYNSYPKILNSFDWNEKFLFQYCPVYFYDIALRMIDNLEPLRVYSMPKLNTSDKNIGTCTFLAVNANSDNKKAVIAYLEDFIAHIMNQETKPLYFQNSAPENNTLKGSLYELYKNGEITFYIDNDVYSQGFSDVVESGADIDEYIKETERKLDIFFNE